MARRNFKAWAVVFTLAIIILIGSGIIWYKQNKSKEVKFKYEVYDRAENIEPVKINEISPPDKSIKSDDVKKKVAIIIDDLGWNKEVANTLLNIDISISFSILPHLPFSKLIANEVGLKNRDILLHLPMEPHGNHHEIPGIKQLTEAMNKDDMEMLIKDYISAIPHVVGVNNHMGSKLTESEQSITYVMEILKNKNLFFIDSLTTSKSLAYKVAKTYGVKTARRNVFLDNIEDEEYIKQQIDELIKIAQENGSAIGIGHPHSKTIAVLQKMVPLMKEKGIEVVPISELVN